MYFLPNKRVNADRPPTYAKSMPAEALCVGWLWWAQRHFNSINSCSTMVNNSR
jgi:hypothetical protein